MEYILNKIGEIISSLSAGSGFIVGGLIVMLIIFLIVVDQ